MKFKKLNSSKIKPITQGISVGNNKTVLMTSQLPLDKGLNVTEHQRCTKVYLKKHSIIDINVSMPHISN